MNLRRDNSMHLNRLSVRKGEPMEPQTTDKLSEELRTVNAVLNQIKNDLATIKQEVHRIHSQVIDASGKDFVEKR
jgi:hypothetical protein